MKVVVIHNPKSGRGLASRLSAKINQALSSRGHRVKSLRVGGQEQLDVEKLSDADAFIVLGGDGSVGYQVEAARTAGTPIYHAGTGNENLFARHFRMRRSPRAVLRAVEQQRGTHVDLASVNGHPMLLMLGTGCDAGVIKRFDLRRTRAIGHLAYIEPVFRESLSPSIRSIDVWVDGEQVIDQGCGQLVVANCPQYAIRSNPARRAQMDDGLLDVVFMPSRSSVKSLAWMCAARLRVAERCPGWVSARGRSIQVRWSDEPEAGPVQIDGEWVERLSGASLKIEIEPKVLPVLLPG